jgi:hypothetical protein
MRPLVAAVLPFALFLAPAPSVGEEAAGAPAAVVVPDADVEAALVEAGKNRSEWERVLAHFAEKEPADANGLLAARFLIANMPGKGYVVTVLKDAKGKVVPYDPLAYSDFEKAQVAYEALEKLHGPLEFKRDHVVGDLETLTAAYLIEHVETALDVWTTTPAHRRVGLRTFLEYVLPYRGSEEPAEAWLKPMRARLTEALKAPGAPGADADAGTLWRWINQVVAQKVRFNERYYLHPTDQGFAEMETSCAGRCEDITNMTTYAARALGLATAADYTPAWGHRDNNHAWNVLLDADGRGSDKAQAHAPKVYRKTFSLDRHSLPYVLPEGREPPNRFLANRAQIDVTDQYVATAGVLSLAPIGVPVAGAGGVAYACVFNGGEWVAVDWSPVVPRRLRTDEPLERKPPFVGFSRLGPGSGGMLYLPAIHDGKRLIPAGTAWIGRKEGGVRLWGDGPGTALVATAVAPEQQNVDTRVVTPVSHLREGMTYVLHQWTYDGWKVLKETVATKEPLRFEDLPSDGLYWLVEKESRRLERPFTIENGRQRFW